ncbi:MAG: YihY family inner membrane protein [Thermoanaerobaculia bacterium]|nr:YihY family inner membrane protein [Thermoanaerobaculia bacterium]
MAPEDPREKPKDERTLAQRLLAARVIFWSWLTDPAVLVYRRATTGRHRTRILVVESFLFIREITREFWMIEGTSRAASLAYTTLLSLIPLLVAFTNILQRNFKEIFPSFESQIDGLLNVVIPYRSPQITHQIATFAENAQAASTLGAIVFMVIAFRLFLAVEGTINQIWKVQSARGYRQKIIAFTMLFFWGPLLMGLSFTTTAMLEQNRILRVLLKHNIVFTIVPVIVLLMAFTMLFWLVPSTRVRFKAAFVGAIVTTALFSLIRFAFGIYADYLMSGQLNVIYGTVGLVIIFLIAVEVMWVIILLGVEISYVWQNLYGVLRASEQQIQDEPRYDLYFAIRAMIEIAKRFERREDAPSSYRLAEQFGSTDSQMLRVLRKLTDGKLAQETGKEWIGFVPGCDPDRIAVEEIVAHIEGSVRIVPDLGPDDAERRAVGNIFTTLNTSTSAALNRMSVGQLVRDLYSPRAVRAEDTAIG